MRLLGTHQGFGRHGGGILSLSWCLTSVEDKLDNLDAGRRSRGQDALLCLMALRESAYSYFYCGHRDFLQSVGTDAKLSITFFEHKIFGMCSVARSLPVQIVVRLVLGWR